MAQEVGYYWARRRPAGPPSIALCMHRGWVFFGENIEATHDQVEVLSSRLQAPKPPREYLTRVHLTAGKIHYSPNVWLTVKSDDVIVDIPLDGNVVLRHTVPGDFEMMDG